MNYISLLFKTVTISFPLFQITYDFATIISA